MLKFHNKLFNIILLLAIFAAMPSAAQSSQELPVIENRPIPECFGVNVHFAERTNARYLKKKLPKHIELLKQAGFGWVRIDLRWDEIEKWEGEYDFEKYDLAFEALQKADIGIVAILGYSNGYYDKDYSPVSEKALEAFNNFVSAAAERYKNMNVIWEIYNEPNFSTWRPEVNVDQYIKLANMTSQTLRRLSPERPIVGPALSGPVSHGGTEVDKPMFRDFLEHVLDSEAAHSWSAITVHPYRTELSAPPETASYDFENIRNLMRDHGYDPQKTPPIAGEWGYNTSTYSVSELDQAAYAVRSLLWATTEAMPFSIWYNWQEQGKDSDNGEHKYGLLRYESLDSETLKKPAFEAIRQTSELLRGYRFDKLIRKDSNAMIVRFIKDGRHAFALWAIDNTTNKIEIPLSKGTWAVTHIMESPYIIDTYGAKPEKLNINSMPVIVTQP